MKKKIIILISFIILIATLIFVLLYNPDDKLSYEDRQIICGLYFGMPQDSVGPTLKKSQHIRHLQIRENGLSTTSSRPYYYVDFYNFDEFRVFSTSGHTGIIVPVFKNKKLEKCFVALGSFQTTYQNPSLVFFDQRISDLHWRQIITDFNNLYPDHFEDLQKAQQQFNFSVLYMYLNPEEIVPIDSKNNNFYPKLNVYTTKYGAIGASYWNESNYVLWDITQKRYVLFDPPQIPEKVNFKSSKVLNYPCIEYVLDKKYYKSLGLEDPI